MSQTTESQFSTPPEASPETEYRPVCALAMVGLLLGATSALAFLGRPAWILPVLAVVLNLIALRQIATSATPMVGRSLAVAGLLLSVFFAGTAVARDLTARWIVREQAISVARLWVDLMEEGKTRDANRLEVNAADRRLPGPPQVDRAMFHYRSYREVLDKFEKLRQDGEITYLGVDQMETFGDADLVTCVFLMEPTADEGQSDAPYFLAVFLKREAKFRPDPDGWMVEAVIGAYEPKNEEIRRRAAEVRS